MLCIIIKIGCCAPQKLFVKIKKKVNKESSRKSYQNELLCRPFTSCVWPIVLDCISLLGRPTLSPVPERKTNFISEKSRTVTYVPICILLIFSFSQISARN